MAYLRAKRVRRQAVNDNEMKDLEEQVEERILKRIYNDPVFLQEKLLSALEENRRLIEDKKLLAETVQVANSEITRLTPAKEFFDRVTAADDWMEMSAVAKVLCYKGYGRNKIYDLLRDKQIIRYNREPYQDYVDRGYFRIIEEAYEKPSGPDVYRKTMVSQKGLDFIRKLIEAEVAA